MSDGLDDHPAAQAWRRARPDASPPVLVEPLKKTRPNGTQGKVKKGVFRLHHGQNFGPTIAKRRLRECLEREHVMYQRVLPQLPIPPVHCLGFVADQDPERAWLFIQDVGGDRYQTEKHDHRVVAARWLAAVHAFGMRTSTSALLPDRGANHYLSELRWSCREIRSHLARGHFGGDDRQILLATLRGLAELEKRWQVLEGWCDAMPRTLIHGDFVAKNCRVLRTTTFDVGLCVFDWETAGWGPAAVDLATNELGDRGLALHYATYARLIRSDWGAISQHELEQAVRIGDALRVVAAIKWACESLGHGWAPKDEMRFYVPHLDRALWLVRGSDVRHPRKGESTANAWKLRS
jgi:hypothetical protein